MTSPKVHRNDAGWLMEFVKSPSGQVFVSSTLPGVTRGNHWHRVKVEKFLVVEGRARIRLRKLGASEVVTHDVCGEKPTVVDIPAGYVHSITNMGIWDLITVFWANEPFDPERPDTHPEEV